MVARSQPVALRRGRGFHVVIDPRARQARIGGLLIVVFTIAALFFLMISARIALDRSAFVLEDIQTEISVEEARYWDLRLEVAELQSPQRISRLADQMGMVYPADLRAVQVPGLGEPGPGIEERWVDLKALLSAQP